MDTIFILAAVYLLEDYLLNSNSRLLSYRQISINLRTYLITFILLLSILGYGFGGILDYLTKDANGKVENEVVFTSIKKIAVIGGYTKSPESEIEVVKATINKAMQLPMFALLGYEETKKKMGNNLFRIDPPVVEQGIWEKLFSLKQIGKLPNLDAKYTKAFCEKAGVDAILIEWVYNAEDNKKSVYSPSSNGKMFNYGREVKIIIVAELVYGKDAITIWKGFINRVSTRTQDQENMGLTAADINELAEDAGGGLADLIHSQYDKIVEKKTFK